MSEVSAKHVLGLSVLLALTMAMLVVGVYVSPASGQDVPVLTVEKTDSADPVTAGSELLAYTITVQNVGTVLATNVVLNDVLQGPARVVATSRVCIIDDVGGTVVCNAGTLVPGEVQEIEITVQPIAEGEIVNTATVTSDQTDPVSVTEVTQVVGEPSGEEQPQTKDNCKNGGYARYGFKNQGQCIKATK